MRKRASLREDALKGVDLIFEQGHADKPERQKTGKPEKVKVTFYVSQEAVEMLEDLRLELRRGYGLTPRLVSKSALVEAALRLVKGNTEKLAAFLQKKF